MEERRGSKQAPKEAKVNGVRKAQQESGKRYNSTFSVFVDSTLHSLDAKALTQALAGLVVKEMHRDSNRQGLAFPALLDEMQHPVVADPRLDDELTAETVSNFILLLIESLSLPAEAILIVAIYLIRLRSNHLVGDIGVVSRTWRRMVLGCVVVTAKVWDDLAVWNCDFADLSKVTSNLFHPNFAVDLNELERFVLSYLEFNVNVRRRAFTECYFNLRAYAITNNIPFGDHNVGDAAAEFERQTRRAAKAINKGYSRRSSAPEATNGTVRRSSFPDNFSHKSFESKK